MSKVLPVAIHDRADLNLRQGIKSSLSNWRQLLAALYLFKLYGGDSFCKEIQVDGKTQLDVDDQFSTWLSVNWGDIANVVALVRNSSLYSAQMEHLQVGLELFLKLAKIDFVNATLSDATERTGGNRYAKRIRFSTNMKLFVDMVSVLAESERKDFVKQWLSGNDDRLVGKHVKELLAPFTEECQYKIRTVNGEIFFQEDGVYDGLRNAGATVESSDTHEPVGPFRILKSYVKEGMHPYISDSPSNGFSVKSQQADFVKYADMVRTSLELIPKRTTVYQEVAPSAGETHQAAAYEAYQLISYGAPGTGKSFRTKGETEGKTTFRTTFHPASDYSTFVGAYKPTMKTMPRVAMINDGKDAVKAGGDEELKTVDEITYDFIPQAFVKAYVAAWQNMAAPDANQNVKPVYLVIEEINRGNCAQIFGDLFQLLDRNDAGYSDYPIEADADLARWLGKQFGGADGVRALPGGALGDRPLPAEVASGQLLKLPPNLYIRATMNTSDQSLFPIDSAFKRRWDWEYVPIKDEGKGWYVKLGADKYKWWSFLEKINDIVYEETSSADKQMGYFFVKLPEGQQEIDLKKFVNKVAFYLWNDVFKDCEIREDALKLKDANGKPGEPIKFTDFFKEHSNELNEEVVKNLFEGLGVEKEADEGSEGA